MTLSKGDPCAIVFTPVQWSFCNIVPMGAFKMALNNFNILTLKINIITWSRLCGHVK